MAEDELRHGDEWRWLPRLRQIVMVAPEAGIVGTALRSTLGLAEPYVDSAVARFGLENLVFRTGHDYLEVLAPVSEDSAGARYLRRYGPGGYMAIFQVDDGQELDRVRRRCADEGIRIVRTFRNDQVESVHLHPKDVGGCIVGVDAVSPVHSWPWGGSAADGVRPGTGDPAAIVDMTVAVEEPDRVREVWERFLGCGVDPLPSGQRVKFVAGTGGVVDVTLALGIAARLSVGSLVVNAR